MPTPNTSPAPASIALGDASHITDLVAVINSGHEEGWTLLIERLTPAVRGTLATFPLNQQIREEAEAETWRTLFEKLPAVREPAALPRWISVVASNHGRRLVRQNNRVIPTDDLAETVDDRETIDVRDIPDDLRRALGQAVDRLGDRERAVVMARLLTDRPEPLKTMHDRLGIPVGSIGPTLGRAIAKLRADAELGRHLELAAS
ncbi:MAG: sigma-70 family RNA polymerase sigma factor [Actinomycetota bacterium]